MPVNYQGGRGGLFDALLWQESRGRQEAVSPKGATGIAQVMPATGPEAAKLAGLQWDENRFRTDANYNAALGRAYFDAQLKRFGGDEAKALAAYNAGPTAVQRAIEKARAANHDNWLKYLPAETRAYVPSVLDRARNI